ncbi:MAG: class I SAM-dependent methyltransferase, partial [Candidatus Binatia bacterium]
AHTLLLQKSDRVLELGCGVARVGRELASFCGRWHGVDISENMLKVARLRTAHLPNVEFHLLSRTSLSMFPENYFDKAYSVAVFIHLDKEDLFLYLQELARVLRPGGMLYFETWNLAHEFGWKRWFFEVEQWAGSDQNQRKNVARNQFCVPEEVRLYVRKAGLEELYCLADSPWIQMIAGRAGQGVDLSASRQQVQNNLSQITYTPTWGRLFGALLDVLTDQRRPDDFLKELDDLGTVPEAEPYRHYLLALWKGRQAEWGTVPP